MGSLPLPITQWTSTKLNFRGFITVPVAKVFPRAHLQQRYAFNKYSLSYLAVFSCQLFSWVVTSPRQSPRLYSIPCKLILPHERVLAGCHWNRNNHVSGGEVVFLYSISCIFTIFCYWKSKYFKKLTFQQNSDKAGCFGDRWTASWHT